MSKGRSKSLSKARQTTPAKTKIKTKAKAKRVQARAVEPRLTEPGFDPNFDPSLYLLMAGDDHTTRVYRRKQIIFQQGDLADSVFFIREGKVKITVVSGRGKEAVVALMDAGHFFGEGALASQPVRMATATAMDRTTIVRVDKKKMHALLRQEPEYSERFIQYLLTRNIQIEEDLVDQLFNSSEKRLARLLLQLAHYGKDNKPEPIVPGISQETLALMIGTTRSRVSQFMNKFRRLGMIDYNGSLYVNQSLLSSVLRDS
jgi:CRP/FNR family transcriptional regulator, cyclic AMP receptor protein